LCCAAWAEVQLAALLDVIVDGVMQVMPKGAV
jgi:hypothetical protein